MQAERLLQVKTIFHERAALAHRRERVTLLDGTIAVHGLVAKLGYQPRLGEDRLKSELIRDRCGQ